MKDSCVWSLLGATIAVVSQGVWAQASSPTRAEVRDQIKTSTLAPGGGEDTQNQFGTSVKSSKTRADQKAETAMARAAGALRPAGEGAGAAEDRVLPIKTLGANRVDRKVEPGAASKAGTTQPAGEMPQPSAKR